MDGLNGDATSSTFYLKIGYLYLKLKENTDGVWYPEIEEETACQPYVPWPSFPLSICSGYVAVRAEEIALGRAATNDSCIIL